MKWYIIFCN